MLSLDCIKNRVMFLMFLFCLILNVFEKQCNAVANGKMQQVFAWNQVGYDFDGVKYVKDSIYDRNPMHLHFPDEVEEEERFFVQYNNVPVGFEVHGQRVFVTVPRRRLGIPSTLNYVDTSSQAPLLKPYPDIERCKTLVSVYRPRVDACDRLWMVDTGLLEIPDARKQVQPPSIVVFDLKTDQQVLRYQLKPSDLVNERTSGGLTSITVEVDPSSCDDAYAYITDLATEGLLVYSMKKNDSWRVDHESFKHDESLLNFTVAGHTIPWRDGLFSLALSDTEDGARKAFYHPMVSASEYSVNTEQLHTGAALVNVTLEGTRGPNPQVGSHAFHSATQTLLSANVAQDAILCWSIETALTPEYSVIVAQDHEKLVYISDLKIVNDEVWVLVNQMPVFVFAKLNKETPNFFIHKAKVEDLIRGTQCDRNVDERFGEKSKL